MGLGTRLLEQPLVYRVWQAPFAETKFAAIRRHNDLSRVRRVLDVGCGPGTNTHHFANADYLGIDINPKYVEAAARRTGRRFIVADATVYSVPKDQRFDFIFLNSFLHHIDTPSVTRLLRNLVTLLSPDGRVHVLELVMPPRPSIARVLAQLDRGDYPRPVEEWRALFRDVFESDVEEEYPLTGGGIVLWHFIYLRGRSP
jgi:SAM-dependent methyltransferase